MFSIYKQTRLLSSSAEQQQQQQLTSFTVLEGSSGPPPHASPHTSLRKPSTHTPQLKSCVGYTSIIVCGGWVINVSTIFTYVCTQQVLRLFGSPALLVFVNTRGDFIIGLGQKIGSFHLKCFS
ncbi:unnamed protein product [Ceratitis capitata]|uniref:(Mediterranean fruit fly) hypothetical protein n=1 Tax=Ceratitis capitata TaxID=7213 RepID=A0A811VBU7_CERCA|nr:unnamed protein product [Ceratitis capitata]